MKHAITAVLIVSSFAALGAARAWFFADIGSFKTPSGNIFCIATNDSLRDKPIISLSCELANSTVKLPPKPSYCSTLNWGKRFYVEDRGQAIRNCYGDRFINPIHATLEYGQVWQVGGFRCDINTERLRCVNLDKHGYELSKTRQVLF